jgi:hypothetical protein
MRTTILAALLVSAATVLALAAPASAVVTDTPAGRIGYLPLNEGVAAPRAAAPKGATVPTGEPPLEYHGGPVMHSQTAYGIFWAPSGYSFPSGYRAAIESYLQNVAADSGKPSNVYSVSAQYEDGTGRASYSDSYGGSMSDTTAFPTTGTCAPYTGFGESFTACISDAKLEAEVEADVSAKGWPTGLGAEYYVVLPPHAGSCFDAAGEECFDEVFCAYHSYSLGSHDIYANISYSPGDVPGCGVGQYPNGHANGNVDDTLSSLSHEANESITDPLLNAWFDEEGLENGDECRNTPFEEDFGEPLGGPADALFNQSIDGAHYYLQQEWSNDIEDCAQRVKAAIPVIANPGTPAPGIPVHFDGSGSISGIAGIEGYEWDFGDGGSASGPTANHTFASPGTYTVTLTLEDGYGLSSSASRQVTVANPPSAGGGGTVTTTTTTTSTTTSAGLPLAPVPGTGTKGLKCRKGFRKTRKHGKTACLKVKKKHRRRHG